MGLLKEFALADLDQELAATRRVLARLPDERFDWRPHEKSMPLGKLAAHLVNIVGWMTPVVTADGLDFATAPPPATTATTSGELLHAFDANAESFRKALEETDEDALLGEWTLRFGDRVIFTRPRIVVHRSFSLSHAGHHRAQLTVYLRLLDVPVPQVYGPTADEPF